MLFRSGISDFSCLFAEDGAKQSFLGGQLGLALGRDLTDQNVTRTNLGTLLDDTLCVQILVSVNPVSLKRDCSFS